jgi:hypothetical protein
MLNRTLNSAARALFIAATFCVVQPNAKAVWGSVRPQGPDQGSGFLGTWCAQGDPAKQASITSNGVFFTLTNETGSRALQQAALDAGLPIQSDPKGMKVAGANNTIRITGADLTMTSY